jgi:hypothetical protein
VLDEIVTVVIVKEMFDLKKNSFRALVLATLLAGCSVGSGDNGSSKPGPEMSTDSVKAKVSFCEFSWNGAAWKFKSGAVVESTDGKSHAVDLSWEVTDPGGKNIYGSHTEYDIRINPAKGLLVVTDTYPDSGIDINSQEFTEVQEDFVCRLTELSSE